jgi:hypothetical protein
MASYYWLKLWIEIVDDAKTATLDDHTWRRFIEFLCLAKERNRKGELPEVKEMAWRLRTTEDDILEALTTLKGNKIATFVPGADRWLITKFADRQANVPPGERMRRSRMRHTGSLHTGYTHVTKRNTEEEEEDSVTKRNTAEEEEEEENERGTDVTQFLKDLHIDAQFDGPQLPFVRTLQSIIDREGPARATALATRAIRSWEKKKKSRYNLAWITEIVEELQP